MLVRLALPAEVLALAGLEERLWRETYEGLIPSPHLEQYLAEAFGPAQQAAELADPACRTLVLAKGEGLLGYACLRAGGPAAADIRLPFGDPLEVARFYVDRVLHGTGAARALMAEVLAQAAREGRGGAWLQVWDQNPRAIRFYAKAGFRDVGETLFPVGPLSYRDRLLARGLGPSAP
jgi:diamine N-acetyltransferase